MRIMRLIRDSSHLYVSVMLQENALSLNTYPDFLWRYAKACHVVAQIKGAAGDADIKKDLLFQVKHVARRDLATSGLPLVSSRLTILCM